MTTHTNLKKLSKIPKLTHLTPCLKNNKHWEHETPFLHPLKIPAGYTTQPQSTIWGPSRAGPSEGNRVREGGGSGGRGVSGEGRGGAGGMKTTYEHSNTCLHPYPSTPRASKHPPDGAVVGRRRHGPHLAPLWARPLRAHLALPRPSSSTQACIPVRRVATNTW